MRKSPFGDPRAERLLQRLRADTQELYIVAVCQRRHLLLDFSVATQLGGEALHIDDVPDVVAAPLRTQDNGTRGDGGAHKVAKSGAQLSAPQVSVLGVGVADALDALVSLRKARRDLRQGGFYPWVLQHLSHVSAALGVQTPHRASDVHDVLCAFLDEAPSCRQWWREPGPVDQ
eukprot:scaffold902_cov242-Pinguiococcus_pyrenoidosus.AAC.6